MTTQQDTIVSFVIKLNWERERRNSLTRMSMKRKHNINVWPLDATVVSSRFKKKCIIF